MVGPNGVGKTTLLEAIAKREIAGLASGPSAPRSILHVKQEIKGDERTPLIWVVAADSQRTRIEQRIVQAEAELAVIMAAEDAAKEAAAAAAAASGGGKTDLEGAAATPADDATLSLVRHYLYYCSPLTTVRP